MSTCERVPTQASACMHAYLVEVNHNIIILCVTVGMLIHTHSAHNIIILCVTVGMLIHTHSAHNNHIPCTTYNTC